MKKHLNCVLVMVLVFGFLLSANMPVEANESKAKKSKWQPSFAKDVKIGKKMMSADVKGKAVNPPGLEKKPKKSDSVATGVLGEPIGTLAEKYAIVIGISDYPGTVYDIALGYDEDATNTEYALINTYGYDPANVFVFQDMDAVADDIVAKINYIKSVAVSGDEVVFYHSGHGGTGYANDGDRERLDEAIVWHNGLEVGEGGQMIPVWDGDLRGLFTGFQTSRIIFIFDSCYSGGMKDVADKGAMFISASKEREVAWTYGYSPEGMLSHYLINESMLQGFADAHDHDLNGVLGEKADVVIEEAFDYAAANIPSAYQTPTVIDNFANDLLLGH